VALVSRGQLGRSSKTKKIARPHARARSAGGYTEAAAASRRARAVHHREEVLDHAGRRRRCGRLGVCGRFLGFFI